MFVEPDRVVARLAAPTRVRGRLQLRPLAEPRARRARGARPGAALVPRRGDRDAGRRARSGRWSRSPGTRCISAPDAGTARRRAAGARVHDQRRQLAERDDAARARDPARPLGARAAALRRADLVLGGAQRRASTRRRSSRPSRRARRVGDPAHARRRSCRACRRPPRSTRTRSTTLFFAGARRAAIARRPARAIAGRDPARS